MSFQKLMTQTYNLCCSTQTITPTSDQKYFFKSIIDAYKLMKLCTSIWSGDSLITDLACWYGDVVLTMQFVLYFNELFLGLILLGFLDPLAICYPAFRVMIAGIGPSHPATLNCISRRKLMAEWMDGFPWRGMSLCYCRSAGFAATWGIITGHSPAT